MSAAWDALPPWGKVAAALAGTFGALAVLRPTAASAAPRVGTPGAAGRTPFADARTDPHGHHTPPGREVAITRAPVLPNGRAFVAWIVPALMALGLGREAALLFAAHVSRETGAGRYVWNNDWGNIKALGAWPGDWYRLGPRGDAYEPFRAYATPELGLQAALGLVANGRRYARPWQMLNAGEPGWYGALGRAGYYESDPDASQREYEAHFLPAVRAWAAAAGMPASGTLAGQLAYEAAAGARGSAILSLNRRR